MMKAEILHDFIPVAVDHSIVIQPALMSYSLTVLFLHVPIVMKALTPLARVAIRSSPVDAALFTQSVE